MTEQRMRTDKRMGSARYPFTPHLRVGAGVRWYPFPMTNYDIKYRMGDALATGDEGD